MVLAANGWWLWTFWRSRSGLRSRSGRHALRLEKGHSLIGYFLFSLVFFPAALIVAYMVSDKSGYATA